MHMFLLTFTNINTENYPGAMKVLPKGTEYVKFYLRAHKLDLHVLVIVTKIEKLAEPWLFVAVQV